MYRSPPRKKEVMQAIRQVERSQLVERKRSRMVWGVRRGHADGNAAELDTRFLVHGATVVLLDGVGDGVSDRLIGYRGLCVLVEYKNPNGRNVVSVNQAVFAELWRGGEPLECRTLEDVESILAGMRAAGERMRDQRPAD